tara:strand:+ start:391 stop:2919 length:2529 start_codon:yes stop_codon:yes gene_type:complete
MINIKEQIGGAEWLNTKCIILIFVTLGLVLFYGKDTIKGLIGFFKNSGSIFKAMEESFKMASSFALEGSSMKCEKTNVKDNCPKLDRGGNVIKKKKGKGKKKKWDSNNCPVETFAMNNLPDRCTDDKYRFLGKDNNCYKNILDADKLKGEYCSINGGGSGIPTCNKYSCPGSPNDSDLQDRLGMDNIELKMECEKRIISAQKDLQNENGIVNQIKVGKSKQQYKELPSHLNKCSITPINYSSFDENNAGLFSFLDSNKNGPPHVMRTDENTGWNHDLTLLCSEKVFNDKTFYDNLNGGGWVLVRRTYGKWHSAKDNLYKNQNKENSVYGDFKNSDTLKGSYSRLPPIEEYTQFLISNDEFGSDGNPTKWMIINKDDLHKNVGIRLKVQSSSLNNSQHEVKYDNGTTKGKPFISLSDSNKNDKENMLYMEGEIGGKTAGRNYDNILQKGVNVFVRKYTNWTQNGSAKANQYNTGWGGHANRAIDNKTYGNWRSGSVTHTHRHPYAWWQVDLGRDYPISKIEIFNRWENNSWKDGKRLRFFNVSIDGDIVKQFGDVHSKVYTVNVSPPKKGRVVKIQFKGHNNYLSLAEVKVWGVSNTEGFTPKIEKFIDGSNIDRVNKKSNNLNGNNDLKEGFVNDVLGDRNPEVFNIDKQYFKYNQAEKACNYFNGTLATEKELKEAYRKGAHWCNPGWVKGGKVMYPIQSKYYNSYPKTLRDQNMCGTGPGVHEKDNTPNLEYGVNCIGTKPKPDPSRVIMGVDDYKEDKIKQKMDMSNVHVNPYSPKKWSKTSTMSTGYKDIPPVQLDQVSLLEKERETEEFTNKRYVENFVMKDKELSEELYNAIQNNF